MAVAAPVSCVETEKKSVHVKPTIGLSVTVGALRRHVADFLIWIVQRALSEPCINAA